MRQDLGRFMPEILSNRLLMCPCCGRLLPQEHFSLEHIVPQQALADDPAEVRKHPSATANIRGGNLLLCTKPLKYKGNTTYEHGCNSWKGKWFDGCIRETLNGKLLHGKQRKTGGHHIIAMLSAGYLAMVQEFGYSVVLMQSGLIMRHQFFQPRKFHPSLPVMCQVLMNSAPMAYNTNNIELWTKPFHFEIDMPARMCHVVFKHMIMMLPLSSDPRQLQSKCLLITPAKDFVAWIRRPR